MFDVNKIKNTAAFARLNKNAEQEEMESYQGEKVIDLEVDQIIPDPNQPRKTFDDEGIEELANDIKRNGLIQPIIVRKDAAGQNIIVAGERRFRAFQKLGEKTIKAIVREYGKDQIGYIQIAENIKRSDLKFWELSDFVAAKAEAGESRKDIADKLGISIQRVGELLAWQEAPEYIKDAKDKLFSSRAAVDLINLSKKEPEKVQEFIKQAEKISRTDLDEFKKSLEEPKQDEPEATAVTAANETSGVEQAEIAEKQDPETTAAPGTTYEPQAGESETPEITESESGNEQLSPMETSSQSAEPAFEVPEADQTEIDLAKETGPKIMKNPLIVGTVDGREAYISYEEFEHDGMMKIRWDNGFIEEIECGRFKINRIINETQKK